MYRRFIATIAAAAVAITAIGAVPAHADNRDALRALAAIAGIAVVGKIIHDERKKKKARHEPTPVRRAPVYRDPSYAPRHSHTPPRYVPQRNQRPGHYIEPRPLPRQVDRKLLPQQCFRTYETRRGRVAMFEEGCLQRNFRFTERLPSQCQYEFGTRRAPRIGYDARCLRNAGYRLARG